MSGSPAKADRASLYVNKFIPSSDRLSGIGVWVSHIEVLTQTGLREMVNSLADLSSEMNPFMGH
jgi:hypothetical protein